MRSFVKIISSRMGEITLPFTDIGILRHCHEFLMSKKSILTLFAKIKFTRKFQNLQILTLCILGIFMLLMSSADIFKINFFKRIFQEHYQSVKRFGSRSGPTFRRS